MTHHHHHHEDIKSALSFEDKIVKLLEHWIKHNQDHAATYMEWAKKAKDKEMAQVALLLEEAAQKTNAINESFHTALNSIDT